MGRLILLFCAAAIAALAADVSGKWDMTVETEMGAGSPVFVLKQDGDQLSGTYTGQLGEAKVSGTVKGDVVEFSFEVSPGGDAIKVVYKGTFDGSSGMKGTVDFGTLGKGTFHGKRKD
jgi:hypothetical protein